MKKLSLVLAFFIALAPLTASASTQVMLGGNGVNGIDLNGIYTLNGEGTTVNNSAAYDNYFPVGGVISNLVFSTNATPPGGTTTRIVTLLKNGQSTNFLCLVGPAQTSCTDSVHSLTVAAGDRVEMSISRTATPPAVNGFGSWSVLFTPTNANDTVILTSANANAPKTPEAFLSWSSFLGSYSSTELPAEEVFPEGGTLDLFSAKSTGSPGAGTSYLYSVFQNAATSSLACYQADTATSCTDAAHSMSVSQGDTFSLSSVATTSPAGIAPGYGVRYLPSTAGDFGLFMTSSANTDTAGSTRFFSVTGNQNAVSAVEASSTQVANAMTITSMSVKRTSAPGSSKTATYTLRKNGTDTALTCSLTGTGSGSGITTNTCTGSVSVAAGDLLDTSVALSSGGTQSTFKVSYAANAPAASYGNTLSGTKQVAIGGLNTTLVTTGERYTQPFSTGVGIGTPGVTNFATVMPFSATIGGLTALTSASPSPGTYEFTLMVNNGTTTLDCTVSGASACTSAGIVAVAAGDRVVMAVTPLGSPATVNGSWGMTITPVSAGDTIVTASTPGINISTTLTSYLVPEGGTTSVPPTTEGSTVTMLLPEAGTLKNFFQQPFTAPTAGSYTHTIREGAVGSIADTSLSCVEVTTGNGICSDTSHTASVTAGDLFDWAVAPSSPTGGRGPVMGLDLVPSTSGNFDFFYNNQSTVTNNATRYGYLNGIGVQNATESVMQSVVPISMTISSFTAYDTTPPGAGQSVTYTLRQNGADTALTCTVSGASATTCTATGGVAFAAGDTIDYKMVTSSGSSNLGDVMISTVGNTTGAAAPSTGAQTTLFGGHVIIRGGHVYFQ